MDNSVLGVYERVVTSFEQIAGMFSEVQLALRQYLEQKRLNFSRFYFLADSDVLEILANANQRPNESINPHCKKLFSCIEKITFEDVSEGVFDITQFQSTEGEVIRLQEPIRISQSIPPELWLNRFDLSVKRTLKHEVLSILELDGQNGQGEQKVNEMTLDSNFEINQTFQKVKTHASPLGISDDFYSVKDLIKSLQQPADIKGHSGEVLALVFAVQFTAQVDFALFSGQEQEKYL